MLVDELINESMAIVFVEQPLASPGSANDCSLNAYIGEIVPKSTSTQAGVSAAIVREY